MKKRWDTNSNSYTLIYSAIIVVIVSFLLAFVSQTLKSAQDANVALDKKKQILYSLNIRGLSDEQVSAKYKEVIVADEVINAQGKIIESGSMGGEKDGFALKSADFKAGKLALYICKVNGEEKYGIVGTDQRLHCH